MNHESIEVLENKAAQQRSQIHEIVTELHTKVERAGEALDVSNHARKHFGIASLVVSCITFALGFGAAGMFSGH